MIHQQFYYTEKSKWLGQSQCESITQAALSFFPYQHFFSSFFFFCLGLLECQSDIMFDFNLSTSPSNIPPQWLIPFLQVQANRMRGIASSHIFKALALPVFDYGRTQCGIYSWHAECIYSESSVEPSSRMQSCKLKPWIRINLREEVLLAISFNMNTRFIQKKIVKKSKLNNVPRMSS